MKRLFVILLSMSALGGLSGLTGCAAYHSLRGEGVVANPGPVARHAPQAPAPEMVDANGAEIERVAFRAGVSTVTVENMAKKEGCWGLQGAGLMTPPGPVEVYRLICDNGAVYTAKCELRQCKRMPSPVHAPAAAPAAQRAPD